KLTEHREMTHSSKSPRVVVLRNVVCCHPHRNMEFVQKFFDVALERKEIEFTGGLMHVADPEVSASAQEKRATLSTVPIDLAEFIHLQVAKAAVQVPLQRV